MRFQHMLSRIGMAAILLLAILAIGASVQATQIIDDEPMPYDMSAVEEMERIEAAEVAHVNSHQPTQDQDQEQQDILLETSSSPAVADSLPSAGHHSFFNEDDVDAFLEQHATQQAAVEAKAAAQAKAKAEAKARAKAAAEAEAKQQAEMAAAAKAHQEQMIKDTQAHAVEAADYAFDHMRHDAETEAEQQAEFRKGLSQLEKHQLEAGQEQEFDLGLDEGAETVGESKVETEFESDVAQAHDEHTKFASFVEQTAETHAEVEAEADTESETSADAALQSELHLTHEELLNNRHSRQHFDEVENAGLKALERAEFLAKVKQHFSPKGQISKAETKEESRAHMKPSSPHTAFLEARARSRSSSTASQPWWASQAGVNSNYQHYQQGVQNSLLGGQGQVANAANSYALPLGKSVAAARLNQKKAPAVVAPPVQAEPRVPVQRVSPALPFNPYSGAEFHPDIAVPAHAPTLPKYMAESQQPFAGAGYYGSGGGQGPHPGSEAYLPLPGVSGKEFGIRAREAWEAHAAKYGADPTAFHDMKNQPEYPYFPTWSRESEIGGRPDLFPKPMFNLPTVNQLAQQSAGVAYRHSEMYYPHLNRPITAPVDAVTAARAQSAIPLAGVTGVGPRLIRRVVGYPRPTAPASWTGTIPAEFPKPRDSNSFEEIHNYYEPSSPAPTLAVPFSPLAGRNIMVNSGPDKGLHPIFGGYPQIVPVPVAAQSQAEVVA